VVEALWRESLDPRTSLGTAGEELLLLEAIEAAEIDLRGLNPPRIQGLIRQLKSAAIGPADWGAVAAGPDLVGRLPATSFRAVFAAYDHLLASRRLADRHDREAAALTMLHLMERRGQRPHYLRGVDRLVIAEIYDLSLLQFMTVAALIRLIGDAQLTIQAAPHRVDTTRFADLTWNRFAGEESIADQVLPEFVRRTGRPGRLGFVIEQLFTGQYPRPPEPDATVSVISANDPCAEADAVARLLRRRFDRDSGAVRPERVAIVARDLSLYRDYLSAAFERYNLALTFGSGYPVRVAGGARILLQFQESRATSYWTPRAKPRH
jgi:hypothetical protein